MKFRLPLPPPLLTHHAPKISCLILLATNFIPHTHWTGKATSYTLSAIGGTAFAIGLIHLWIVARCTRCSPAPAAALRRPHNRFRLVYGRYGLGVCVVFLLAASIGQQLLGDNHAEYTATPYPSNFGEWSQAVLFLAFNVYLSCRTYYRLNDPVRANSRELHTWLKERAGNLAHHSYRILLIALVSSMATLPLTLQGKWSLVHTAASLVVCMAVFLDYHHAETLCERCAGDFRTDAPEYAGARTWKFRTFHRSQILVRLLLIPLVLFASMFAPQGVNLSLSAIFYLVILAFVPLSKFHMHYQPWCPICHPGGGGGDDDEEEPTPDPTPGKDRPLPVA